MTPLGHSQEAFPRERTLPAAQSEAATLVQSRCQARPVPPCSHGNAPYLCSPRGCGSSHVPTKTASATEERRSRSPLHFQSPQLVTTVLQDRSVSTRCDES